MEDDILFSEIQKFKQWWLWLIIVLVSVLPTLTILTLFAKQPSAGEPAVSVGRLITAGCSILPIILVLSFKLETQIKRDGVYARFFPLHLSFRKYTWDMISESYVRQYSPLGEYGGWGIRYGLGGAGKAFNISGNKGLQLVFTNNKKLLIGTNNPEELTDALKKLGQLKPHQ